jgi:hypothetical protein
MNHYCDGTSGTYRCKAGFECQNAGRMSVCECPTNEYWDGSACRKILAKLFYFDAIIIFNLEKLRTYGDTCSDWNPPCDYSIGLVCSTGGGTGCSCPNTYGANFCDCPITKFWNGTFCGSLYSLIHLK